MCLIEGKVKKFMKAQVSSHDILSESVLPESITHCSIYCRDVWGCEGVAYIDDSCKMLKNIIVDPSGEDAVWIDTELNKPMSKIVYISFYNNKDRSKFISAKLLVGTGGPFGIGKTIEIIDLMDSSKHCLGNDLPSDLAFVAAGLVGVDDPFFCGGFGTAMVSECYSLQNQHFNQV